MMQRIKPHEVLGRCSKDRKQLVQATEEGANWRVHCLARRPRWLEQSDALREGPAKTWLLLGGRGKGFRAGERRRDLIRCAFKQAHSGCCVERRRTGVSVKEWKPGDKGWDFHNNPSKR